MDSSCENLPPQVMARLARQIKAIMTKPPEGVRYVPTDGNITEVFAEIMGPDQTPYEGGVFKVKLVLGKDYPATPPRGFFLTKIFHPNVASAGDICVNTLKRDWKPDVGLSHVLQVIRCLLIVPFPESSLNDEAGKLFMDSYDDYASHAKLMTSIHALPATSAMDDDDEDTDGRRIVSPLAVSSAPSASAAAAGVGSGPAVDLTGTAAGSGVATAASASAAAGPASSAAPAATASAPSASKKSSALDKKKKEAKRKAEKKKKSLKRL